MSVLLENLPPRPATHSGRRGKASDAEQAKLSDRQCRVFIIGDYAPPCRTEIAHPSVDLRNCGESLFELDYGKDLALPDFLDEPFRRLQTTTELVVRSRR